MTATPPITNDEFDSIQARSDAAIMHESLEPADYAEIAWASARDVPALIAEVRALRAQLREVQDDAWKRGYDACKTGEQRHSPYRAVKSSEVGEAR